MGQRTERFLGLSGLLTGFDRLQLQSTDMTDEYLRELDAVLPAGMLDDLLAAYDRLPDGARREAAVAADILDDQKIGPVARNLVLLWYCGTWTSLPDAWRAAYGISPLDTNRVVSGEAYQAGLQWLVAGAHPAGAAQQGYGAWALPPGRGTA